LFTDALAALHSFEMRTSTTWLWMPNWRAPRSRTGLKSLARFAKLVDLALTLTTELSSVRLIVGRDRPKS